jgi:hypothetical protein
MEEKVMKHQTPAFELALNALREQIERASMYAEITSNKIAIINELPDVKEETNKPMPSQSGILGFIWDAVNRLANINQVAERNENALTRLVG